MTSKRSWSPCKRFGSSSKGRETSSKRIATSCTGRGTSSERIGASCKRSGHLFEEDRHLLQREQDLFEVDRDLLQEESLLFRMNGIAFARGSPFHAEKIKTCFSPRPLYVKQFTRRRGEDQNTSNPKRSPDSGANLHAESDVASYKRRWSRNLRRPTPDHG